MSVDTNSWLYSIVGTKSGKINSAHHQSADLVGKGLVANAFSRDGIIEGPVKDLFELEAEFHDLVVAVSEKLLSVSHLILEVLGKEGK